MKSLTREPLFGAAKQADRIMNPFTCSACGRRDWPREDTSCPLCAADDEREAFTDGGDAAACGREAADNPYLPGTGEHTDWAEGWADFSSDTIEP
jgi:hypothetical protein